MTNSTAKHVVEALAGTLSATDSVLRRTQLAHWNVTGPQFFGLHAALETQYQDLFAALDAIAERIRALGTLVPNDYAAGGSAGGSDDVIESLIAVHEKAIAKFDAASNVASQAADEVTAGLLLDRLDFHQKTLWMLRATGA